MDQRLESIQILLHAKDWPGLKRFMQTCEIPEIADVMSELHNVDRVLLFRVLPQDIANEVFSYLDVDDQKNLLASLTDEEMRLLMVDLNPDDRTTLLSELPGQVTQRLLNLLSPNDLAEARALLGYPKDSVGRLMTPDYVAVRPEWTVVHALEHIRAWEHLSETINTIYVTDAQWKLLDAIELRRFVFANPTDTVETLMDGRFVAVTAASDREQAVQLMQRYDLNVMPVLDSTGVLVGIVTVDDVWDVAEAEVTEDIQKSAAVSPLRTSYLQAGVWQIFRRRITWLVTLVFMNILSGGAISLYEDTLASALALAFFLPLLIGSGGNAGAQSATLMVRALATGEVQLSDWGQLIFKEFLVAFALGITMAVAVSFVGYARAGMQIAFIVSVTMVLVVIVGSMIGLVFPFILSKLRIDPATASGPLITSLADIAGVMIYFTIATWVLGL
jgi:magnesium transporter